MSETIINVPGRFNPIEYGTPLANASDIYDTNNEKSVQETLDDENDKIALQDTKISILNTVGTLVETSDGSLSIHYKIGDIFYKIQYSKSNEVKHYYVAKVDGFAGDNINNTDKFIDAGTSSVNALNVKTSIIKNALQGDDAYKVYVNQWIEDHPGLEPTSGNGFLKQDEWLESLIGDDAYEVAVKEGFEGSKSEWLASLKGDKGDNAISPFKGLFPTIEALQQAHPSPNVGDTAYVYDTSNDVFNVYDVVNNQWHNTNRTVEVPIFASGQNISSVYIVDEMNTGGSNNILSAEMGKLIKENFSELVINNKFIELEDNSAIDDTIVIGNYVSDELESSQYFKIVRYEINRSNLYYGSGPSHTSYNRYVYYWGDAEERLLKKETLRHSTSTWEDYLLIPPQGAKYLYVNEIKNSTNLYQIKEYAWKVINQDKTNLCNPKRQYNALASDIMPLKSTLNGLILNETKINLSSNYNYYIGFYVNGSTSKIGSSSSGWGVMKIYVGGINSVRFVGYKANTKTSTAYGFCDTEPSISADYAIDETIKFDQYTGSTGTKEYTVNVPNDKRWMVISIPPASTLPTEDFYCYTQVGYGVKKKIDNLQDDIYDSLYEIKPVVETPEVEPGKPDTYTSSQHLAISNASIGNNISSYYYAASSIHVIRYEIIPNKKYYLTATWNNISPQFALALWTDESLNIIRIEQFVGQNSGSTIADEVEIIAPANAKYLYLTERINGVATNLLLESLQKKDFTPTMPKKNIKILAIGNSYSQDALSYIPFILPNITNNIELTIGILYKDGASLQDHWDCWSNPTDSNKTYTFYISENGGSWTSESSKTIQYALDNYEWDIILTQQKSSDSYYPSDAYETNHQPYLNNLINAIQSYIDYPVKFGWMLIQSRPGRGSTGTPNYTETQIVSNFNNIIANAQTILSETLCELVIPWGTAIQNARTLQDICALGRYGNAEVFPSNESGKGYLTYDGVHLQEGLPCLIAAYTVILSLLSITGENYNSIIGDDTVPTSSWISNKGIPGTNGSSIGATIENTRIAQKCAVMAFKKPYEITDMNYIVNPT